MSLTKFGGFIKEICPCKKDMNVTRYKCVIKQQNIQNNNNIPNMEIESYI